MDLQIISKYISYFCLFLKNLIREAIFEYLDFRLPEILKNLIKQFQGTILMDPPTTCKELGGISRSTLFRLKKSGKLKGLHVEGSLMFERSEVLAYIQAQKEKEDP